MPNVISDAVMSQTFLILLKQLNEKSSIDAFIESSCMVPMLKCMKELDNIYSPSQKKGWSGFLQYWLYANDLKRNCYEAAYILQTSWKSALIPYLANIPIRIGYLGNFRYGLLNVIHHESNYQSPMGKNGDLCKVSIPT